MHPRVLHVIEVLKWITFFNLNDEELVQMDYKILNNLPLSYSTYFLATTKYDVRTSGISVYLTDLQYFVNRREKTFL